MKSGGDVLMTSLLRKEIHTMIADRQAPITRLLGSNHCRHGALRVHKVCPSFLFLHPFSYDSPTVSTAFISRVQPDFDEGQRQRQHLHEEDEGETRLSRPADSLRAVLPLLS